MLQHPSFGIEPAGVSGHVVFADAACPEQRLCRTGGLCGCGSVAHGASVYTERFVEDRTAHSFEPQRRGQPGFLFEDPEGKSFHQCRNDICIFCVFRAFSAACSVALPSAAFLFFHLHRFGGIDGFFRIGGSRGAGDHQPREDLDRTVLQSALGADGDSVYHPFSGNHARRTCIVVEHADKLSSACSIPVDLFFLFPEPFLERKNMKNAMRLKSYSDMYLSGGPVSSFKLFL